MFLKSLLVVLAHLANPLLEFTDAPIEQPIAQKTTAAIPVPAASAAESTEETVVAPPGGLIISNKTDAPATKKVNNSINSVTRKQTILTAVGIPEVQKIVSDYVGCDFIDTRPVHNATGDTYQLLCQYTPHRKSEKAISNLHLSQDGSKLIVFDEVTYDHPVNMNIFDTRQFTEKVLNAGFNYHRTCNGCHIFYKTVRDDKLCALAQLRNYFIFDQHHHTFQEIKFDQNVKLDGHSNIFCSPDKKYIAVNPNFFGNRYQHLLVYAWDGDSKKNYRQYLPVNDFVDAEERTLPVVYFSSNKLLAVNKNPKPRYGIIDIYDTTRLKKTVTVTPEGAEDYYGDTAFSPDGNYIAFIRKRYEREEPNSKRTMSEQSIDSVLTILDTRLNMIVYEIRLPKNNDWLSDWHICYLHSNKIGLFERGLYDSSSSLFTIISLGEMPKLTPKTPEPRSYLQSLISTFWGQSTQATRDNVIKTDLSKFSCIRMEFPEKIDAVTVAADTDAIAVACGKQIFVIKHKAKLIDITETNEF